LNGRQTALGSSPGRPFVIAHRSGNSLVALRLAEALGVHVIEADLHLFRGRIEVRHLKTIGRVPILWDRWKLASPFAPRLLLADLLRAVGPETELVLDLKGRDRRLAESTLETVRPHLCAASVMTICARSGPLLEPFHGVEGIRRVRSVGSARQLRRLRRRVTGPRLDGISIHERLIDSSTVPELRELAELIMTWPVNTRDRARELIACGVDGLISDRPFLLQPVPVPDPVRSGAA
jgi:glycerophosphoryl diester phosphodiesterase